jgi:hypothetical protein
MSPLRRLLTIRSRIGNPGTLVSLGHSGGSLLYLEAAMQPVSVVVALEVADVEQLHGALAEWLRERVDVVSPEPFRPAADSPLIGGLLGRVMADAGRARRFAQCTDDCTTDCGHCKGGWTVQSRTVHSPDQGERDRPAV